MTMISKSKLSVFGLYFNHYQRDHGSFFNSLFETFLKGSQGNRQKIADAFPEYFNKYDIDLDYPRLIDIEAKIKLWLPNEAETQYEKGWLIVSVYGHSSHSSILDKAFNYCRSEGLKFKGVQESNGDNIPWIVKFYVG